MRRCTRLGIAAVTAVAATLALTACAGDDDASGGGGSESSGAAPRNLTVGGATFTEMQIMQQLYGQLLTKAGYTVDYRPAENRETYAPALESGEVDVVPEYAATMAEYLNGARYGEKASLVSSAEVGPTVAALTTLAEEKGLAVLEPARAASENAFFVTRKYADANRISTLSQLAAKKPAIRLAAAQECDEPARTFCAPGLTEVYGFTVTVDPTGYGTLPTKQRVTSGAADVGQSGTTDGTLAQLGLVILDDDKNLQLADNLVPVVNEESAGTPEVAAALNRLAPVLTTEDLAQLNLRVDGDRRLPADVAREYLTGKDLL